MKKLKSLIVVLGHSNDAEGALSQIAKDRCNAAFACWQQHPEALIICTGGFGNGFNQTQTSHGDWLKAKLLELGVPDAQLLDSALSKFTLEDATCTKQVLAGIEVTKLYLLTSDFHLPRASMIFAKVFKSTSIQPVATCSELTEAQRMRHIEHEKVAIVRDRASLESTRT